MADCLVAVGGQFAEESQMFWEVRYRYASDGIATQVWLRFFVSSYKGQESPGFG